MSNVFVDDIDLCIALIAQYSDEERVQLNRNHIQLTYADFHRLMMLSSSHLLGSTLSSDMKRHWLIAQNDYLQELINMFGRKPNYLVYLELRNKIQDTQGLVKDAIAKHNKSVDDMNQFEKDLISQKR